MGIENNKDVEKNQEQNIEKNENKPEVQEQFDKKLHNIENDLTPNTLQKPKDTDDLQKEQNGLKKNESKADGNKKEIQEENVQEENGKTFEEKLHNIEQSLKPNKSPDEIRNNINNNADASKNGDGGDPSAPPENPDKPEKYNFSEIDKKVMEVTQPYYDKAREITNEYPEGADYTGHTEEHVFQVAEKSQESADALESAIDKGTLCDKETAKRNEDDPNRVNFKSNIDRNVLEAAALSHDTGMSGEGYNLIKTEGEEGRTDYTIGKCENYEDIRKNHSLNSAVNVLENREEYKKIGFSDEQVDMIAVESMAHSKSNSGVQDLNNKEDWNECFKKIDKAVEAYNVEHEGSGKKISFDRGAFENNDERLGQLATSALSLRIGDVSRDSGPNAKSQSGVEIHVDRTTVNDNAETVKDEVDGAVVKRGDDPVESEKSKQVHIGEQNITGNKTFVDSNGKVTHEITINDMNSGKISTQEAMKDHLGEMGSAPNANFNVDIKSGGECSEEAKTSYEVFRADMHDKYENIKIQYPWDK